MADLTAICNGVANAISSIPGLRVASGFVATVNPPQAIVLPMTGAAFRPDTLDGGTSWALRIVLLVPYAEDTSSVSTLNSFLASTGASSIYAAIKAAPRLAGVYDYVTYDSVRGYGMTEWSGQQYLGATIQCTAMAATP